MLLAHNCRQSGLYCGEDLAACDAVYVKSSDGKVYRADGSAAAAAARVRGYAAMPAHVAQNDAVTIMHSTEIAWPNTAAPGSDLFLSGTVLGGLDTVASTGGVNPIAYVKDAYHIFAFQPR